MPDLTGLIRDMGGPDLDRIFGHMEIAEREITRGTELYRQYANKIWDAFMMLQPDDYMSRLDNQIYRAHCRELIDRIGHGASKDTMELGTDAEALIAFSEASLAAPLTSDGTYAFLRLFRKVMGKDVFHGEGLRDDEFIEHESYNGALDELISLAKRKCSRKRASAQKEEAIQEVLIA